MTLIERIAGLFLPPADGQLLRTYPEGVQIDEAIIKLRQRDRTPNWNAVSVREALGVPAIFGAVSLIANTVGSLSLEAFRQGVLLAQEDAPRLIVRPNPFTTPRDFFRDTAFYLATRGEAWWWIAARDIDGVPMSLYPIPPWEITVAQNDFNRLKPKITWGKKVIDNDDIRHLTYLPGQDGLRGVGPMQMCGAAMSVTVESQEWAANFFGGSLPSVIGTTEQDMSDDELERLNKQWSEKAPNTPRWLTNGLSLTESPFDADKAQLTEQRQHQVGEAARMFLIPGALLEYQMSGSSLHYQNDQSIWRDFHGRCLGPNYIEPIEQHITDLLTRATSARFNTKQLLRSDPKTRMEVHALAITNGIYDAATAAKEEGYAPGHVDFAPVPLAPPQATPSLLPINRSAEQVRCSHCNKIHGYLTPPYSFTCHRCKTVNENTAQLEVMRAEQPPVTVNYTEVHPAPPAEVHIDRGAIQIDLNVEAVDLTPMAAIKPAPMTVEMSNPDLAQFGTVIDRLADRPIEITHDTKDFANAIIDLKAELARRKEIVRDENGRIVAVR